MHANTHNNRRKEFILRSHEPLALTAGIALYQGLARWKDGITLKVVVRREQQGMNPEIT